MKPLIGFLPLILLGATGCKDAPKPPQAPPPQVTVATPFRKQIVEWHELTGRLAAVQAVEVKSRLSGHLRSIHFKEGEVVDKDDLLFVIDPRPYETELTSAEAQLQEAIANEEQAKAQVKEREAELEQAKAALDLADKLKNRAERLYQSSTGAGSLEEMEIRKSEFLQARASLRRANANLTSAKAGINTAEAKVESKRVAVGNAKLNLSYTQIRAPIRGRIGRWEVSVGDFITGGTGQGTQLTNLVSLDRIHCYFDANEQVLLEHLRRATSTGTRNQILPVYLSLADEENYPHKGYTDFVDNQLGAGTASILVRAIFPNPDQLLVPGMFAKVQLPARNAYEAILIPDEAISTDQTEKFVYVVGSDNTVKRVPVKTGPKMDGLRVVRSGLTGKEKIIIRGLQRVRPKAPVTPVPGTIKDKEDGLPNDFKPVTPEETFPSPVDATPWDLIEKTKGMNVVPAVKPASHK